MPCIDYANIDNSFTDCSWSSVYSTERESRSIYPGPRLIREGPCAADDPPAHKDRAEVSVVALRRMEVLI